MNFGFLKWPLKNTFDASADQEVPANIGVIQPWLDVLADNVPTPDEPVEEFKAYFGSLEEAVRAKQYVTIGPSGRVRPSSPMYSLADETAAQKTEAIFHEVFENEDWAEHSKDRMLLVWQQVPNSLKKMCFTHEEHMSTPATIYRTADSLISGQRRRSAEIIDFQQFKHEEQAVQEGGEVAELKAGLQ